MSEPNGGEPVSRGRRDRRPAGRQDLADALVVAGSFGVAALVTGLLAMLLIELLRAGGWWN
jgi:hypothetical protein